MAEEETRGAPTKMISSSYTISPNSASVVDGWSVQYTCDHGNQLGAVTSLSGTMAAGAYYLVQKQLEPVARLDLSHPRCDRNPHHGCYGR